MNVTGHTGMYCLIGSPVSHSGSPAMYNYSFEKLGYDDIYLAYDVKLEDTEAVLNGLRLMGCKGFNVTMPCKTAVAACCDELSKAAEMIGAVNTAVFRDGKLIGHNTDGYGFVRNCRENGFDITGKKMTIAGAGGAATAIEITCALEGAKEISIFTRKNGRTRANAVETVRKIKENCPDVIVNIYDLEDKVCFYRELADSDIFTNATSVGMKPDENGTLIEDTSAFRRDLVICDIVYNPRITRMIKEAQEAGCRTIPGIGMLLWQGVEAFMIYTGEDMPAKEVQEKYFS